MTKNAPVYDKLGLTVLLPVLFCLLTVTSFEASGAKPLPDVRIVIDVSGSMKKNDPNNLRRSALELLVQLLPKGAKAGVWTFGQYVNNLVPLNSVDKRWRKLAIQQVKKINSVAMFTDIGKALEITGDDFHRLKPTYRTSVILLTDGMVDVSKNNKVNAKARAKVLSRSLQKYIDAGVTIHTIALSRFADRELLEQLAIDTNGIASIAESADDLMKIFLQAFDDAAPAEQVPLQGNRFFIDASIDEYTALVFRKASNKPTELVAPDGTQYDKGAQSKGAQSKNVKWHSTAKYDLITVLNPQPGEWQIEADLDPDNRVTVISDLTLEVTNMPRNVFLGDLPDFKASMAEDGRTINKKDFLSILDVSVAVRSRESKKRWKKSLSKNKPPPVDGYYQASLSMLKKPGPYEFVIDVDGKTFKRSNKQLVSVREDMELRVRELISKEQPTYAVVVYSRNSSIKASSCLVMVKIQYPSGKVATKEVPKEGERRWQLLFTELKGEGRYEISVEVEGEFNDGKAFSFTSLAKTFIYGDVDKQVYEEEELQIIEQEPEASPEPEPTSEPAAEPQVEVEEEALEPEETSNLLLYIGIGVGNLLLITVLFFVYRTVAGSKASVLDDGDDDSGDIDIKIDMSPESEVPSNDDILGGSEDEGDDGADDTEFTEIEIEKALEDEDEEIEFTEIEIEEEAEKTEEAAEETDDDDDDDDFDMDDIIDIAPDKDAD